VDGGTQIASACVLIYRKGQERAGQVWCGIPASWTKKYFAPPCRPSTSGPKGCVCIRFGPLLRPFGFSFNYIIIPHQSTHLLQERFAKQSLIQSVRQHWRSMGQMAPSSMPLFAAFAVFTFPHAREPGCDRTEKADFQHGQGQKIIGRKAT
jgi:hypothetical protein